jgi:iron complex outermembrane receptor protein
MKKSHLIPILSLLFPVQAFAEDTLEHVIITATQRPESVLEIPMSIAVVSAEDLEIVRHIHVNEAFQRVSGAWISRGNGQESLTALRSPVLTGAGSCGAFFMAGDGISLRSPGFCNVNQLFDANTEQAQRIEVLKGPSTALYGSGAMHGVINVITPAPTDTLQQSVGGEAGPHDYVRGRYQVSNTIGAHGFYLGANASHDGGYKRSSGYDQQKVSLRHQYDGAKFNSDTILTGVNLDQDTAGFIQGYEVYKDSDQKKDNPNPDAYRDVNSFRAQSTFSFPISESSDLAVTPYYRNNDMEFLQHFLPWQSVEKNGHDSYGINTRLYHDAIWLNLVSGVDLDYTDGWLKETQDEDFSPNQPKGVHYDYQVDALVAAAWSQAEWDVARNWNISGGLRFDYTDYDYDNRVADGPACEPGASACRFYRPADRDDDFGDWSFNLGVLFDYRPEHAAYLRLARGFRAPQVAELYRLQAGQQTADLDSEEIDSIEFGLRGSSDVLEYEIGTYYMDKDNVIFQDANRRNVSGAKTRHYGVDFSVRWQVAETVDLAVDGTVARHEYDSEINLLGVRDDIKGNRIDTAPDHFGSLRLGWDFLPAYRAELEWVHMNNYYIEPANNHDYDGHELLNLRLRGDVTRSLTVGVRVTNLLDEDYAERADFGFGNYRYFVGEPRSLYVSLDYRFGS